MSEMDSILLSIKKKLNIAEEDKSFDTDIIISINTVLMEIMQEWHGMDKAFTISDETSTWDEILGEDASDYEALKDFIYLKVRMLFDPPTNSALIQQINEQIKNLEWRMYFWKDLERIDSK